jgi:dihydroxyacid dehydratase/phosphogluconate dehydratase
MKLRSEQWWNDPSNPGMTALYLERFLNYGLTPGELQSGRPVIGIAQSANDIAPCNRAHLQTVTRLCDGVRRALCLPHASFAGVRAAAHRGAGPQPCYLGLVEVLHGYPLDGVIFTTGCDKTTPAALMAAATTDLPALIFNGGPMLNSYPVDGGTLTLR